MTDRIRIKYSNARRKAEIPDWPHGQQRVTARFWIEGKEGRERACRQTTGKVKKLTFARRMMIVDGDDGKTYILAETYGLFCVMQGNMKYEEETIHSSNAERFAEISELMDKAYYAVAEAVA